MVTTNAGRHNITSNTTSIAVCRTSTIPEYLRGRPAASNPRWYKRHPNTAHPVNAKITSNARGHPLSNFLNRKNEADRRVFELLSEKFKLFEGVFGASDEVLGAIESGVDFEKRINAIYQRCRKHEEITAEFDKLQLELNFDINEAMTTTRRKLLENWWVWMSADVIYIALYCYKALYFTGFLYLVLFAMCIAGFSGWRRSFAARAANATLEAPAL